MKKCQKYLYILLISSILLLVSVFIALATDTALPCFHIQSQYSTETEDISIFDAKNGNYYVFLPSYTNLEQVSVSLPGNLHYSVGDSDLYEGMDCSNFKLETPYDFAVNAQTVATLWFYQSANVATMYIDTASGSMDYIHKDKNHEEYASLLLYTPEGTLDFQDDFTTLKGRGNATWHYDKRPYSLKLSGDGNLLEMGSAANWILLANAYDETNLNNKLVLDLASRVGLQWTPESRWVDLYLNGEYSGLYLLTEKVEIHDNRLNIDTNSGDFLCKIDLNRRWDTLRNPFLSEAGRTIEISSPEIPAASEQIEIEQLVNQMEQTLLSETDLRNSSIIDLDSWVRRYLIDEIAGNIDSDLASSYFYYHDGVFFAGPVWDYDMVFGNSDRNRNAHSFIARNEKKSATILSPYYSALYANESFYNRMLDIYRAEFTPVLQSMIDNELVAQSDFIRNASKSNSVRWQSMFDTLQSWSQDTVHTNEGLREYLSQRIDFLNSVWLESKEYCTVQFEPSAGGMYWTISIPKAGYVETSHIDTVSTDWINTETGEIVDFSQPIMTDMILSKQITETESVHVPWVAVDYITLLSITILFILLIGLMILDIVLRRKERVTADERKQAKVSS